MDRRRLLIAVAAALALGGAAAALLWPHGPPPPKTPILTIDSNPSGARVRIDGVDVGQTPYYSDNRYRPGPVKVQLSLKGYRDWAGQFDGGADEVVSVTLVKPGPAVTLETVSVAVKPAPDAGAEPEWRDPDLETEPK